MKAQNDRTARADRAAPESAPETAPKSARTSLRQDLAGLSYDAQLEAVRPPLPVAGAPVVQRTDADIPAGLSSDLLAGSAYLERVAQGGALMRAGCSDTDAVTRVQSALTAVDIDCGPVDGLFGPLTSKGVWRFQSRSGLSADAIVGPMTLDALDQALGPGSGDHGHDEPPTGDKDDKGEKGDKGGGGGGEVPIGELPPAVASILTLVANDETREQGLAALANYFGFDPFQPMGFTPAAFAGGGTTKSFIGQSGQVTQADQAALSAWYETIRPWNKPSNPHVISPPRSLGDVRSNSLAFGLSRDNWDWMYQYSTIVAVYVYFVSVMRRSGGTGQVNDPHAGERASIVATALGEVGKAEAHTSVSVTLPNNQKAKRRYGGEHLKAFFHLACSDAWRKTNAPDSKLDDPNITIHTGLPSWCGIFSTWALATNKVAGAEKSWDNPPFKAGFTGGFSKAKWGLRDPNDPNDEPLPGDVAYDPAKNNHYCLVVASNGGSVITIDGNIDPRSNIMVMQRPRTSVRIVRTFKA